MLDIADKCVTMLTKAGDLAIVERMTSVVTRSRRAAALLMGATAIVLGLLVVFGIALARSQQNSRATLQARMQQRAVSAASVVDGLFATVSSAVPGVQKEFSTPEVSAAALEALKQADKAAYMVVVDPNGNLLASSSGYTSQAHRTLLDSGALRLVGRGGGYVLGDLGVYGHNQIIALAVGLSTPYGNRVLVEGLPQSGLGVFLNDSLRRLGNGLQSYNMILDSHDTIVATSTPARPVGHRIASAAERAALSHSSATLDGRYYVQQPLDHSTWRLVLSEPDSVLFASVSGAHQWLPWLILIAFALVGGLALWLGWRVLHSAEQDLADANARLESLNVELAASNRQLECRAAELQRSNEELDQFASIASHDLQEPLRKVRTFTERLVATEGEHLSERGNDYLRRANHAAERMQGLIQDLLEFSRITTKPRPFAPVDLGRVVGEVLEDLAVDIEESGARVEVGALPTLDADAMQMRQLMLNLIGNAVKFARPGVAPEVNVSAQLDDGQARLLVTDNGIGFEQQYAARIFRVFERLNGRGEYPGSGIGLALCHKIVGRHGGSISASSEPGRGATFTVLLPLRQPDVEADPLGLLDTDIDVDHVEEEVHAHT